MITILLNGENKQIEQNCNIDSLLAILDMENRRLAVEVNQKIVPRSSYASYTLGEADVVEIVQAIGGG